MVSGRDAVSLFAECVKRFTHSVLECDPAFAMCFQRDECCTQHHCCCRADWLNAFSFAGTQTQGTRESVEHWELPPFAVVEADFAAALGKAEEQPVQGLAERVESWLGAPGTVLPFAVAWLDRSGRVGCLLPWPEGCRQGTSHGTC